jgi:xanthine dehydrogenase molybdopterin-binding subunit B
VSAIAPIHRIPPPHESGHKHVTGAAMYVDDAPPARGELVVWP